VVLSKHRMKYTFWTAISILFFIGGEIVASATLLQDPLSPTLTERFPSTMPVTTSIMPVKSSPLPISADTTVALDGELVCLPHRAGGQKALTLECAIGLRTTEGKHYALENINPYIIDGKVTVGQRVKVNGLFRSGTATQYDTVGIIHITSIDKLDQN
jgi:hypothetical protein